MKNKAAATVQVTSDKKAASHSRGRLRTHLIKGAAGSFALQIGFAGFAFLNAIILARVLGAEGYGTFANAMAWVSLLTIPATFGFGILLVRDTAIYRSRGQWGLLKGLLRFSDRFVLVLSVSLAVVAAIVAGYVFAMPARASMRHTIWIALGLLPLLALYNLREAATRGLEHVISAQLPGMIVRPGLLFAGIVGIYYFWPHQLSASTAMAVNVGAGVAALAMGVFFLRKLLPTQAKAATAEYTPRPWLRATFPMLVYGGAQIVLGQTDIVMLGAMRGAEDVGLYAVANRLAFLLGFVIMATDIAIQPTISKLYSNNETARLQSILTKVARLAFLVTILLAMILFLNAEFLLGIFGKNFVSAKMSLYILISGRLIDVTLGANAMLLSMIHRERIVAITFVIISLVNIAFNILLIPKYGIIGAAISSVATLLLAKLYLSYYAIKVSELNATIFGNVLNFIRLQQNR